VLQILIVRSVIKPKSQWIDYYLSHLFICLMRPKIRFSLKLKHLLIPDSKATIQNPTKSIRKIYTSTFYTFRTVNPISLGYRANQKFPDMSERTSWPVPLHQPHNNGISFPTLTCQLTSETNTPKFGLNTSTVTSVHFLPTPVFNHSTQ